MEMITIVPYIGTPRIVKNKHKSRPLIECWQAPELKTIVAEPACEPIIQTIKPNVVFTPLMKRAMQMSFKIQ